MWDAPLSYQLFSPPNDLTHAEYLYAFNGSEQIILYLFDIARKAIK